jgi:hypothetical protein
MPASPTYGWLGCASTFKSISCVCSSTTTFCSTVWLCHVTLTLYRPWESPISFSVL